MGLPFTASQIDQLKLAHYLCVLIFYILSLDDESKDAVGSAAGVVDFMWRHHLIFESLPEIFESVFSILTLKSENIFNNHLISNSIDTELKPRDSLKSFFAWYFVSFWV